MNKNKRSYTRNGEREGEDGRGRCTKTEGVMGVRSQGALLSEYLRGTDKLGMIPTSCLIYPEID